MTNPAPFQSAISMKQALEALDAYVSRTHVAILQPTPEHWRVYKRLSIEAMVTHRLKPFVIDGKTVYQVGIPWHWGWAGVMQSSRGDITNDLVASLGDPTTFIQESKALLCNVRKGVA